MFYINKSPLEERVMFKRPEEAEIHLLVKVRYVSDFVNSNKLAEMNKETAEKVFVNLLRELQKELREVEDVNIQRPSKLFLASINRGREAENLLIETMEGFC